TISKPEDIAGKKIGVGKSTAQLDQLKEFSDTLPTKVDLREYPTFTESYAYLAAGRIAGVANSLPNGGRTTSNVPFRWLATKAIFG
ncbi:transporter substrate-binding domain-containing protein, partial [Rhizobium leguminosarum]